MSIAIHVNLNFAVIETNLSIHSGNGAILSAVLHHPAHTPRGAAILCHGMESAKNSEKLIFLAQSLAERGILALRFDFRYVGESSGKFNFDSDEIEVTSTSPMGAALMKARIGDVVKVDLPRGTKRFEVLAIR